METADQPCHGRAIASLHCRRKGDNLASKSDLELTDPLQIGTLGTLTFMTIFGGQRPTGCDPAEVELVATVRARPPHGFEAEYSSVTAGSMGSRRSRVHGSTLDAKASRNQTRRDHTIDLREHEGGMIAEHAQEVLII